jgi:hypothetical protein
MRDRPGEWVEYGRYATASAAETVRRRVHRGCGFWAGGRAEWSVMVRKQTGVLEWVVYVAHRTATEVAS